MNTILTGNNTSKQNRVVIITGAHNKGQGEATGAVAEALAEAEEDDNIINNERLISFKYLL